jgi:hypothetical protein
MSIRLIEAAQKSKEIMARQDVFCPRCNQKQFSPFDKLYVFAYEMCYDCTPDEHNIDYSDNIFEIIGL